MKKMILSALSVLLLCVVMQVQAEELKIYTKSSTIAQIDNGAKGYSVSDVVARAGLVYLEENGPAVGEFYSQAQISHIDDKQKKDVRFFVMEINLPEGTIMTMDFTPVDSGPLAIEGHKHIGVIVGGTGKYRGVRGSYELFINSNAQKDKIIFNIV